MKIKYDARYEGESAGTRKSTRTYTHAIVDPAFVSAKTGLVAPQVITFCGRLDLAEKALRSMQSVDRQYGVHCSLVIVPVTVEA